MPFRKLIDGYMDFYKSYFGKDRSLYDRLVNQGQNPETLVIACSDSRIDPAIVTTSGPGDLFVVRNVAAIVPPYETDDRHHGTSAAIEFAVKVLKVKRIIVMGHALCGGVNALANRERTNDIFDFIGPWIDIGRATLDSVQEALPATDSQTRQKALEQALILTSLRNLTTFPWIKEKVDAEALDLHGWYFDVRNGVLEEYDPAAQRFHNILKQVADFKNAGRPCGCGDFSLEGFLHNQADIRQETGT